MCPSATDDVFSPTAEEDEDFEVLIDEAHFCVVRHNGVVAAQVHSPINLTELQFQLAAEGYIASTMMAYEDGVLEILLRELGDVPGEAPLEEVRILETIDDHLREREVVYG